VLPATYVPRMLWRKLRERDPAPPFGQSFVVAWTGMRGIVSLAAAFALPISFPKRDLILFLTFSVILATLVFQGLSLPAIIRFFGLTDDGSEEREEHTARLEGAHAALARLEALAYEGIIPEEDIEQIRAPYTERVQRLAPRADGSMSNLETLCQPTCADDIQRELIHAERKMVTFLRDEGVIGDDVLRRLHNELDHQEARLGDAE
jgi:monovalent cation/hydrogen antiporter